MNSIDLDFDDDLAADAKAFGQAMTAQGAAKVASHPAPVEPKLNTLEEALHIAREVYGETNSEHSEAFCQWVQVVLEGGVDIDAAKEMLTMLHEDKEGFGGRIAWEQVTDVNPNKIARLHARRHASICAMNVVHAALNKFRGRSYMIWVQRSFWRASKTEKDVKSER